MEQVIISLILAAIKSVPEIVASINASTRMSEAEKDALLFEINVHLSEAVLKVQAVRFKEL